MKHFWWIFWVLVAASMALIYYQKLEPIMPDWVKPLRPGEAVDSVQGSILQEGTTYVEGWKVVRSGYHYELSRDTEQGFDRGNGNLPVNFTFACYQSDWYAKIDEPLTQHVEVYAGAVHLSLLAADKQEYAANARGLLEAANNSPLRLRVGASELSIDSSNLGKVLSRLPPCVQPKQ